MNHADSILRHRQLHLSEQLLSPPATVPAGPHVAKFGRIGLRKVIGSELVLPDIVGTFRRSAQTRRRADQIDSHRASQYCDIRGASILEQSFRNAVVSGHPD